MTLKKSVPEPGRFFGLQISVETPGEKVVVRVSVIPTRCVR